MSQIARAEPPRWASDFGAAVLHGLSLRPRRIASKWLYDAAGSRLFDEVVAMPAYYVPTAEMTILSANLTAICEAVGPQASVVELGSGASVKVRVLLDGLLNPKYYVPVEISAEQLAEAAETIRRDYPALSVLPVLADYTRDFVLPEAIRGTRILGFFPGSTLCNMPPPESAAFLRRIGWMLGRNSHILIGADLKKDESILLRAYNDPHGPIWLFNLNILERMNRELGTELKLSDFRHQATYNREAGRIEAAIYPLSDQETMINGQTITLPAKEPIVLEHSYKFDIEEFQCLARRAGWMPLEGWTDPDGLFSVHLLRWPGDDADIALIAEGPLCQEQT
jgi:dimethylhistidine N-methyltransferase